MKRRPIEPQRPERLSPAELAAYQAEVRRFKEEMAAWYAAKRAENQRKGGA